MADYWSQMYDALKYIGQSASYIANNTDNSGVTAAAINNAAASNNAPTTAPTPAIDTTAAMDNINGVQKARAASAFSGLTGNILSGNGGFEESNRNTSKILLGYQFNGR